MECYFCNNQAKGICQICGRMSCREHSVITSGKFTCSECARDLEVSARDLDASLDIVFNHMNKIWLSSPKCSHENCNTRLYDNKRSTYSPFIFSDDTVSWNDILSNEIEEDILNKIPSSKLTELISQFPIEKMYICACNQCLACKKHQHPDVINREKRIFSQIIHYQCQYCGTQWKIKRSLDDGGCG